MEQHLTTLDTNITTEDIPTCVCEKSIADETEKFCLNGAYGGHSMVQIAMTAAIAASEKAGAIAGEAAGIDAVITALNSSLNIDNLGWSTLNTVLNGNNFKNVNFLVELIKNKYNTVCVVPDPDLDKLLCLHRSIGGDNVAYKLIETNVESAVISGTKAATAKTAEMTPIYTTQELSKVTSTGAILSNIL
ncbi:rifin PIR protein,putative [Plasmodium sp. DRC-Itaito]|nr:rifin PIR protein,putative [Plasmodium sp. DRC-Itaito]